MSEGPRIRLLVAEDEPELGALLRDFLERRGHAVTLVGDGEAAVAALAAGAYDVALLDLVMPKLDGLSVLRTLREAAAPPEVIITTGQGTMDAAIAALRLGAYDYMTKPYRMLEIEVQVRRAWEKRELLRRNAVLAEELARVGRVADLESEAPEMRAVLALVERLAPEAGPVTVVGEPGTGRRTVAQALHRLSGRGERPFVEVACDELPAGGADAALAGEERAPGAAAGGRTARPGFFEAAHGGTLFLAGVDALEPRAQGRLLRLLEDGAVTRVGGSRPLDLDVRVVASLACPLADAAEDGRLRSDLSYRLGAMTVALPPLRARAADIPRLAERFLRLYGGPRLQLAPAAHAALAAYPWPGNVAELRAVIERAALVAAGPRIEAHELAIVPVHAEPAVDGALPLDAVERRHVEAALAHHGWHQGRAAQALGISPKTLYRKIRAYGLARPSPGR